MRALLVLVVVSCFVGFATTEADPGFRSAASGAETVVIPALGEDCIGELVHNHDGSFENGYCWDAAANYHPHYGAYGESYDLGPGILQCAAYWLTTRNSYWSQFTADCYVWEGGVSGTPGMVLAMEPHVSFDNMAWWPEISQHDVSFELAVEREFTVGYWGDWQGGGICGWFVAVDETDPGGAPWTFIAPGIGWPMGWQHPGVVWGDDAISLGIGLYFTSGTSSVEEGPSGAFAPPERASTWGAIKTLFD